jgi:hypothetical protein
LGTLGDPEAVPEAVADTAPLPTTRTAPANTPSAITERNLIVLWICFIGFSFLVCCYAALLLEGV